VPALPARENYSRSDVRRMLEISERRLRSWERQGLAPRSETYTFADLIVLRALVRLQGDGASAAKILRAVTALRDRLGAIPDPFKDLKFFVDGGRIAVQIGESRMEAVSGQFLLNFDEAELPRMLVFPKQTADDAVRAVEAARRFESSLWFEKALEMEGAGEPLPEVIEVYERALELDPSSAGVLVNLGTIYFHLKDWEKAERSYRKALEADPQYALAHFNLGNLFDEKGDPDQALLHYTLALRLDPTYGDAHYNLALLYQSGGQVMRAVRHWKAYLKLDPSSTWAAIARQELDKLRRATVIEGTRRAGGASGA
jgi:tetratricopeptide (TPR) repeat protein